MDLDFKKENEELRERLSLYERGYEEVREAKILAQSMELYKEYRSFCDYFFGTNPVDELHKNNLVIEELLSRQVSIARSIKGQSVLYEKYTLLCFLNEKLFNPSGKLLLLLQMVDCEDTGETLAKYMEEKIAISETKEMLKYYYDLLEEIANKAKNKNSIRGKFCLCMIDEEEPTTEKERNKREIRNNTIRNFYKKHGEKMFLPENLKVLYANLKKVGIKVDDLQEAKLKQIVRMCH